MANYELQITLQMTSFLTADAATNTYSIIADDDLTAEGAVAEFINFHEAIVAGYSALVAQGPHTWKLYRRADPIPRAPIAEADWAFSIAPSGNALPTEVAICVSFQGQQQSGIPQARRRGRVFIGPLDAALGGTDGRPAPTTVSNLRNAAQALLTASETAIAWSWAVFSPTSDSAVPVVDGWVDNEWDTQRRRGRDATSRSTFT